MKDDVSILSVYDRSEESLTSELRPSSSKLKLSLFSQYLLENTELHESDLMIVSSQISSEKCLAFYERSKEIFSKYQNIGLWAPKTDGFDVNGAFTLATISGESLDISSRIGTEIFSIRKELLSEISKRAAGNYLQNEILCLLLPAVCLASRKLPVRDLCVVAEFSNSWPEDISAKEIEKLLIYGFATEQILWCLVTNKVSSLVRRSPELSSNVFARTQQLSLIEISKTPTRTRVINEICSLVRKFGEVNYLEIGLRNPADNFDHIIADHKYSVDPGVEYKENPATFKMKSDEFFTMIEDKQSNYYGIKFDVIFIDGLHLAEQVERDIENSLNHLTSDGFIIMHDCNPPTEYHAREDFNFSFTPASYYWNGTTWKAFMKARKRTDLSTFCVDCDWGVGVISRTSGLSDPLQEDFNPYYEFRVFESNRELSLGLIDYENFKLKVKNFESIIEKRSADWTSPR